MRLLGSYLFIFIILYIPDKALCAVNHVLTPHIDVEYVNIGEHYAKLVSQSAEKSFQIITRELGYTTKDIITITLTSTDDEFRTLTEGTLPDWSAAVALPGNRIIISPLPGLKMDIERILAHEIVHCIIHDAARDIFVPRWFHEGCAEALSGEWGIHGGLYMVWKVSRGELMTFQDIEDVFSARGADVTLAYDQSMLAVNRLISSYGTSVLPRIIEGLRKGKDFDRALYDAAGITTAGFEQDYLNALSRTYGKRMLITLVPGTWTIILVLAFIVYFIKKRRSKRLMAQWDVVEAAEKIIQFKQRPPDE
jgi:hypothetical protein